METWKPGESRIDVQLICCPHCGALDIYRRGSKHDRAHWRCRSCHGHWSECLAAGRGKACNGKLPDFDSVALWQTGQSRIAAEVVCCPDCGCTKVRRSSLRTIIAYWYCDRCGQGWNEMRQIGAGQACRVKLATGTRSLARICQVPSSPGRSCR